MNLRKRISLLSLLLLILVIIYVVIGLNSKNWEYVLSRRIPKIIAIILTGSSIAFSSLVFQTITNNNILTPSVLGLDSLYIFFQTFIVFVLGSKNLTQISNKFNFILSVGSMVIFSICLFHILFRKEGTDIFFLLLLGLVGGTFFQSLSSFMQVLIDPNEFYIIQNKMFASFNNVNTNILSLACVGVALTLVYTRI